MPRYEATLSDGQVVTIESDHPPTEDEVLKAYGQYQQQQQAAPPQQRQGMRQHIQPPENVAPKENRTSFLGTMLREAGLGVVPTVVAKEAGELGIGLGTTAGAAVGGGPGAVAGGIVGAIGLGGAAGGLADYGQEQLLKVAVPDFMKDVEAGRSEHKVAATLGRLGVGFGLFKPDLKTIPNAVRSLKYFRTGTPAQRKLVTDAMKNLGIGAASGVAMPLMHGQLPGPADIALGAAQAAVYGRPYSWTRKYSPGTKVMESQLEKHALNQIVERISNASGKQEAEGVHEPVSAPPVLGTKEVPTEGGGPGVREGAAPVGEEAQVPLEPAQPEITGNDKVGYKVKLRGRFELGFPTREAAEKAASEAMGGARELKYAEGQPMSREDMQRLDAEHEEQLRDEFGMTPDEVAKMNEAERAAIDESDTLKSQVLPGHGPDDDVPFGVKLGGREFMKALGQNRIGFNRAEFRRWVLTELYRKGFSVEEIMQAVRARVHEEWLHNIIIDAFPGSVGKAALRMFWRSLSPPEQAVVRKKYYNKFGPDYVVDYEGKKVRDAKGRPIARYSEYQLAHEALRQIFQREYGLRESEISQTMAVENFGLRSLGAAQRLIRMARERMGGRLVERGQEVMQKAQDAIDAAVRDKSRAVPQEMRPPDEGGPAAVFRGGEGEAGRPDKEQLEQKKVFLSSYIARAQKQVDAADLKGDHQVAASWQARIDNARQQLEQVARDLDRGDYESSFPAASKREDERKLKYLDSLVGRLTKKVDQTEGEEKQMWQKRLDEATSERDKVKGQIPPLVSAKRKRPEMPAALRRYIEADDEFKRFVNESMQESDKMGDAQDKLMILLHNDGSGVADRIFRHLSNLQPLNSQYWATLVQMQEVRGIPESIRSAAKAMQDHISRLSEYARDPRWQTMHRVSEQGQDRPDLDAYGDIAPGGKDTAPPPPEGQMPAGRGRKLPPEEEAARRVNEARKAVAFTKSYFPGDERALDNALRAYNAALKVQQDLGFSEKLPGPTYLGDDLVVSTKDYIPTRGWMRPDGKIIRVGHQHEVTARELLEEAEPNRNWEGTRPTDEFMRRGYLRLVTTANDELFFQGWPTQTQRRELQNLATEHGKKLISDDDRDFPMATGRRREYEMPSPKLAEAMIRAFKARYPKSNIPEPDIRYPGWKGDTIPRSMMDMIVHWYASAPDREWRLNDADKKALGEYFGQLDKAGYGRADMLVNDINSISAHGWAAVRGEPNITGMSHMDLFNEAYRMKEVLGRIAPDRLKDTDSYPAARRRGEDTPEALKDLTGARAYKHPEGIDEKSKLMEKIEKLGVTIDGQHYAPNTWAGMAGELILTEGKKGAIKAAEWAVQEAEAARETKRKIDATKRILEIVKRYQTADVKLGPEIPFPGWKDETQLRLDLPGGRGRKKQDIRKEPLLFGDLTTAGEQAGPGQSVKPVPPEERAVDVPPLTEDEIRAAARPPPSPQELYEVLKPAITAEVPDYLKFHEAMQKAFGPTMANAWSPELWENATWKELMAAEPQRLAELVRDYEIGGRLGLKKLPIPTERDVERARKRGESAESVAAMEKQVELFKGAPPKIGKDAMVQLVERMQRSKRFKSMVISRIAEHMLKKAAEVEDPKYSRKEGLEFDDISFLPKSKHTEYPGYYEFSVGEANSPRLLQKILSDGARAGHSAPVSASYRVVVLRNRWNGQIEVLSVYNHGRKGAVIYRPSRHQYMPLDQVPLNLQYFATFLMKQPLQRFTQYFKNTAEFQNHFDTKNALRLSQPAEEAVTAIPAKKRPIEGSEGIEGGAGGVQGPESDLVLAMRGLGTGELERAVSGDAPLEGSEAGALHDILSHFGVANKENVEDVLRMMERLADKKQLEGKHYQAMAALYKIAGAIQRVAPTEGMGPERPPMTQEELHDKTVQAAFESFKKTKSREGFIFDALLNFGWDPTRFDKPVRETAVPRGPESQAPITIARFTGRPIEPTGQRPLPMEGAVQPAPMTTANPGTISGPEYLSSAVREAMEQLAQSERTTKPLFPSYPLGPSEVGGEKFTGGTVKGKPTELPHEAQVSVETSRKGKYKYGPPEFIVKSRPFPRKGTGQQLLEPPGYLMGPQRERTGPAAARRNAIEYSDELDRYMKMLTTASKRGLTFKDVKSQADGVDRASEVYTIRNSNSIRWASIGKSKATWAEAKQYKDIFNRPEAVRIRKAVVPWNAALRVAEAEEWARVNEEYKVYNKAREEHNKAYQEYRALHDAGDRDVSPPPPFEMQPPEYVPPTVPKAHHFDQLIIEAEQGMQKARDMINSPVIATRRAGRIYLKGAEELLELAKWTKENLQHPNLKPTADEFRNVMNSHLNLLLIHNSDIASRRYYVPNRYRGEMWDDGMMTWGDDRVLGKQQRMPKVFNDYYEAIKTGPYAPVNLDSAALAQHSMISGARSANWQEWGNMLTTVIDPVSKWPIAIRPTMRPVHYTAANPETGVMEQHTRLEPQVPKGRTDYELIQIGDSKGMWLAVRVGYKPLVEGMMAQSKVPDFPMGKAALYTSQGLKHGVILLLDTFHPGRLFQYASVLGGRGWTSIPGRPGWKSGWSAISWHPEDIPKAVEAGLLSPEQAKWALEPIKVYDRNVIRTMTRHELASIFLTQGLNATQQADALYRNAVQKFPGIGQWWYKRMVSPVTKFVFDRYTPGIITEMAIRNFERLNKGNRATPMLRQMRDIARDANAFYGNMGRQGFFQNPTFRDLAQIFTLAPLWQEGLIRKELTAASRLLGISYLRGRRAGSYDAYLGPLTYGMIRGLGTYFVLTQALNLITKGHFTWDNKEEGRKMDAWLPTGKDGGIWISPLSVFAETTHDFIRLYQTRGTAWEAATRLGFNKLGPFGRIFNIFHDMKTPQGEAITSTPGVIAEAAKQFAPLPISLGAMMKEGAFQAGLGRVIPGVQPTPPGAMAQRTLSAVGVKSELDRRPEQDIARMADKFARSQGLKYQPMKMIPTDEASYAKLRGSLRNKDYAGAKRILADLRKTRTDEQILHGMRIAATRPFTGSNQAEELFLYSLSNDQLDLYTRANQNRMEHYQDFLQWFMSQ